MNKKTDCYEKRANCKADDDSLPTKNYANRCHSFTP